MASQLAAVFKNAFRSDQDVLAEGSTGEAFSTTHTIGVAIPKIPKKTQGLLVNTTRTFYAGALTDKSWEPASEKPQLMMNTNAMAFSVIPHMADVNVLVLSDGRIFASERCFGESEKHRITEMVADIHKKGGFVAAHLAYKLQPNGNNHDHRARVAH